MRRREFIGLLALAWPVTANAQQPTAVPTVGVLVLGRPDPEFLLQVLRESLQKLGYVEGQNIRLQVRSAGGDASLLPDAAADLVRLKVDILIAWQTPAVAAAKHATREIPIVMAGAGDPVGTGLIASLARPGGNITGVSGVGAELAGKSIELIREVLPAARRLAVLANATDPFTKPMLVQIELAAQTIGIGLQPIMSRPGEELHAAFADMLANQADAVFLQPTLLSHAAVDLALKHRLPSFSINRQLPATGGLMSYSNNIADQFREAAVYVDRILKGSKPGDLAVAQPTKFELFINLRTAKALGLSIPPSLLARADEVIE